MPNGAPHYGKRACYNWSGFQVSLIQRGDLSGRAAPRESEPPDLQGSRVRELPRNQQITFHEANNNNMIMVVIYAPR